MAETDIGQDVDRLITDVAKKVDELIDSSNVVGEKITLGDTTIIPLMAAGFGFGAGGGAGQRSGEDGAREGTGGGGGVKPVAIIVVNPDGVQVTPVPGAPSGLEKLGSVIGEALSKRGGEASGDSN